MDLNSWFQSVFDSPGHFLLALVGLIVLVGLIGGLTDSRQLGDPANALAGEDEPRSGKPWWKLEEEHYCEWDAQLLREQHRDPKNRSV